MIDNTCLFLLSLVRKPTLYTANILVCVLVYDISSSSAFLTVLDVCKNNRMDFKTESTNFKVYVASNL